MGGPLAAEPAPSIPNASIPGASAVATSGDVVDGSEPPRPQPVEASAAPDVAQVRAIILRAWSIPAIDLDERIERTARAGYQLGMRELEAPARALLLNSEWGSPLERSRAAVRLAPGLPAAHASLGSALWEEGSPIAAMSAYMAAAKAVPAHLDASLWARSVLADWGFRGLLFGALMFLTLVALESAPRLVRDLGRFREDLPSASRWALLASLVLLPAAFGEGLAGLVAGLVFLAALHGSVWRRAVVAVAVGTVLLSAYPMLEAVSDARAGIGRDPIAVAAHAVEHGLPTADELARVRYASAAADPLAARALALRTKRSGDLTNAAIQYTAILDLAGAEASADLLNNAAGVLLAQGELGDATKLYERASNRAPSPLVLFNLSQAYGRGIRLDEQDLALAEAQAIDPAQVAHLTGEFGGTALGLVTDIPVPAARVAERMSRPAEARRIADGRRRRFVPGWMGQGPERATIGMGIAWLLGMGLGLLFRRSLGEDASHYSELATLLQNRSADSAARMRHIARIRKRQVRADTLRRVASFGLPGAIGAFGGQPLMGWLAATAFAFGVTLPIALSVAPVDPLALGSLPSVASGVFLTAIILSYLTFLGIGLVLRERD